MKVIMKKVGDTEYEFYSDGERVGTATKHWYNELGYAVGLKYDHDMNVNNLKEARYHIQNSLKNVNIKKYLVWADKTAKAFEAAGSSESAGKLLRVINDGENRLFKAQ